MASKTTIIKAIGAIKTIYSYFGKDTDIELLVDTWAALLSNYTDEEIDKGVFMALRVCKYAPVPADIIEQIERQREIKNPTESELWALYSRALRDTMYYANRLNYNYIDASGISQGEQARLAIKKIWQELPQELKIYVGDERELLNAARCYNDENSSYERNRFNKTYPLLIKRVEGKRLFAEIGNNLLLLNEK